MLETTEKGYVMVPRQLIHDIIRECPEAAGEQEAFLRVLLYANYKESVYRRNGVEYVCARGESLFSYLQWAEILGWSRGRTMRFFKGCSPASGWCIWTTDFPRISASPIMMFGYPVRPKRTGIRHTVRQWLQSFLGTVSRDYPQGQGKSRQGTQGLEQTLCR